MMSATPERSIARKVVSRVRERESFAHETLDSVLRGSGLSSGQIAFATRLAYGTIAARGTLDEIIMQHVRPGVRMQPLVGDCLALSTYELLFMRTPPRAAVHEGVELVKAVAPRASTLANAVLRRVASASESFPWGDPSVDDDALARATGHPNWMVRALVEELGRADADAILHANNEPAPLYLAHMPFKASFDALVETLQREGARPREIGLPGAVACDAPSAAIRSTALTRGWAIVVDAAAQFVAASVPLSEGAVILDVGAGRGTKSLLIASRAHRLGIQPHIIAVDSHAFKLDALHQMVEKTGAPPVSTVVVDATDLGASPLANTAVDAALVDAPCSGLGTLRRHPDRRWRALPDDIALLAAVGAGLLRGSASLVKPGGFVVYSTCTIVKAENEQVIEGFLASPEGHAFRSDPLDRGEAPEDWARFFTSAGAFRSLPTIDGPDGHFAARLRRVIVA